MLRYRVPALLFEEEVVDVEERYANGPRPLPAGKLVLVVDDDADCLETMEVVLLSQGYRFEGCQDPRHAREKARRLLPDVLLTDLRMPRLSGFQLIEQLRADPVTAGLRLVVCSADVTEINRSADWFRAMGCDLLVKPFELDELFDIVAND